MVQVCDSQRFKATTRHDSLWPDIRSCVSPAQKEKQAWAVENSRILHLKRTEKVGNSDGGGNGNKEALK